MVKFQDQIIHEYNKKVSTFMCCRNCQIIYGQFTIFKNVSRRFWSTKFSQLNDNVKQIIKREENFLYCDCKSLLGMFMKNGKVFLLKEYMEIVY